MKTRPDPSSNPQAILDSINDGIYVTDTDRAILYWSKSAERITGWPADDILGKHCYDNILCHVDKDDHRLCGEEYCPLHRSIVTGQSSDLPIVVFAQRKTGGRVPLRVSVAPIVDAAGAVVGGVETFRDLSTEYAEFQRVKKIQALALRENMPEDDRISFRTHYVPHDVIGGDYYAIEKLDADRYGFMLADVTGHGVPAALYTMFLSSLWESNHKLVTQPGKFAEIVSQSLCKLVMEDEPFAAGTCGVFDLNRGTLQLAGAGNPSPILVRRDGRYERLDCSGFPLGLMEDVTYEDTTVEIRKGDCLLFFTDGAIEVPDPNGRYLGVDGLVTILEKLGYPSSDAGFEAIEAELLVHSDRIRFDDDLTFLEVRLT